MGTVTQDTNDKVEYEGGSKRRPKKKSKVALVQNARRIQCSEAKKNKEVYILIV